MDEWVDGLELNIFFNNISVIWVIMNCSKHLLDPERIFEPDLKIPWSKVGSANCLAMPLNPVSYQCARGKSFIARKPEVNSKFFKLLQECNPPDFKFYLVKLSNKMFPHMV